ncbi:chromate resistance protein [Sphingobium phenoxybenzoativorans]|uniref:Chromate resistance protein n=1 Tax=Sphingobium phenoxybenzoativorans TaxID=1592790 RepID=A0A975Q3V4_9SPHN|nr:chromate resistance protein ChrB domain-containing protein [Sphingobium phenoxybenzoativorans]QUT07843.1 chromate resistance protein [Sphingobium phenoxybenzoativorans]
MRWATREHIHFDRAISAWLIKRFVDPDAEFLFLGHSGGAELDSDVIQFGLPGIELSSHDQSGSTFEKILRKYSLSDPHLKTVGDIVASGLSYLFNRNEPDSHNFPGEVVVGLLAIVEGVVLSAATDEEALEKSLMLYDAVYALVQGRSLSKNYEEDAGIAKMGAGMWRTAFSVTLASDIRASGAKLGPNTEFAVSEGLAPALQRLRDR